MLTLLWLVPTFAADTGVGANLVAMGGVGAAASEDNAGITLNPGLIALHPRFDFGGMFQFGPQGGMQWGGHAVDARQNEHFALGITYTGDRYEPPLTVDELPGWIEPGTEVSNMKRLHDVTAAVGVPVFDRKLCFGVGANLGWYDNDRQGDGTRFDADAGVGIRPIDALTIGIAARNLVPVGRLDRPASGRVGVRVEAKENVAFETNTEWFPEKAEAGWFVGGGVEKSIQTARLRAGWQRNTGGGHAVTAGVGIQQAGAAIEYGVVVPVTGPIALYRTVHALQVRFAAPAPIPDM